MTKKLLATLAAVVLLGGCAANYMLDGQKYGSSAEFQRAVDDRVAAAVGSVSPLPSPLTSKKLIVAFPAESAIYQENVRRVTALNGRAPMGVQAEMITNLSAGNYKLNKVFIDALQKRNIYPSVQFKEMPAMVVSLEPSSDTDVMYYSEASQGAGQWFYASAKHGKQVFAYDRSGAGATAKVHAFVDAVQVQAIRE
jgi:hypothetical protein